MNNMEGHLKGIIEKETQIVRKEECSMTMDNLCLMLMLHALGNLWRKFIWIVSVSGCSQKKSYLQIVVQ